MSYAHWTEDYDISSAQIDLPKSSSSGDSAPLPPTDTGMEERQRVYEAVIENQRQR